MIGDEDQWVSMDSLMKYKEEMERFQGRFDLKRYKGESHAFFNKKELCAQTIQNMDDFLVDLGYLISK